MKRMKNYFVGILVVVMLFSLSACGCNHDWVEAYCERYEYCSKCDEIRGEPLGHSYYEGYCERCGQQDPDFLDLNNFGFTNMQGMSMWVQVVGYKLSSEGSYVDCGSKTISAYQFNNDYIKSANVTVERILEDNCSIKMEGYENFDIIRYGIMDNDAIQLKSCTWAIQDRVIKGNKGEIIIKIKEIYKERDYEVWYVPTDLLDLSSTFYTTNDEGKTRIRIYFKESAPEYD